MPKITRSPKPLQTEVSPARRRLIMFIVALGGFGIGVTEFVSMGLLPLIAEDFQISEDTAGNIISAYALGVVVGAPLITVFTGMVPRRRLTILLMLAFTVGNGLSIVAKSYGMLLVARFIAGFPHGAYFSVSTLAVVSMTPKGERGKAVAMIGLGFAAATLVGVPAAQWLGQQTHWSAAYMVVAAIGLITMISLFIYMPHMTEMKPTSPITELGALKTPQVLLTLLIGTVGFGGMFATYTYIGWTMTDPSRAHMDISFMPVVLMAYGLGGVFGNMLGGWLADRNVDMGIGFTLAAIALSLISFYFTSANAVAGIVNFLVVGMFGSSLVPQLQIRLMDVAGRAQTLAAALSHSALNLANAMGAALGGMVIAAGYSYASPALVGASLGGLALLVWAPTVALRRRARSR